MKIVALVPMKANSERVKGKNFKDFCGKPLFRWILDTLESIDEIDTIVINTDARDILFKHNLIDSKKILIRDRKQEICGDLVSMNKVIQDDVSNIDADFYIMTHTTNPLVSHNSIKQAIAIFKEALAEKKADSLFSVTKFQERLYDSQVHALNHDPKNLIRTQDLNPLFIENSNLYLFTNDSFRKTNARIGINPMILETDQRESIDIDTTYDWELAEIMAEYYKMKGIIR
jgi:CMP-N-acetylneuraminic acid synthetase